MKGLTILLTAVVMTGLLPKKPIPLSARFERSEVVVAGRFLPQTVLRGGTVHWVFSVEQVLKGDALAGGDRIVVPHVPSGCVGPDPVPAGRATIAGLVTDERTGDRVVYRGLVQVDDDAFDGAVVLVRELHEVLKSRDAGDNEPWAAWCSRLIADPALRREGLIEMSGHSYTEGTTLRRLLRERRYAPGLLTVLEDSEALLGLPLAELLAESPHVDRSRLDTWLSQALAVVPDGPASTRLMQLLADRHREPELHSIAASYEDAHPDQQRAARTAFLERLASL